jgi:hypothetical protein
MALYDQFRLSVSSVSGYGVSCYVGIVRREDAISGMNAIYSVWNRLDPKPEGIYLSVQRDESLHVHMDGMKVQLHPGCCTYGTCSGVEVRLLDPLDAGDFLQEWFANAVALVSIQDCGESPAETVDVNRRLLAYAQALHAYELRPGGAGSWDYSERCRLRKELNEARYAVKDLLDD